MLCVLFKITKGSIDCTADNGELLGDENVLYGFTQGTGPLILPQNVGINVGSYYSQYKPYSSVIIQVLPPPGSVAHT